jgi:DnaJ-domain-containing protein 1
LDREIGLDLPLIGLLAAAAILAAFAAKGRRLRLNTLARRPPSERMSLEEARAVLGVGPTATPADIRAAYARLMRRTHPDHGGTSGLAAQLNAARDRLSRP